MDIKIKKKIKYVHFENNIYWTKYFQGKKARVLRCAKSERKVQYFRGFSLRVKGKIIGWAY